MRNNTLNLAAYSLGQLVGAGLLSETPVLAGPIEAAQASGLVADDGRRSVLAAIHSGLEAGIAHPRDVRDLLKRPRARSRLKADGDYRRDSIGRVQDRTFPAEPPPAEMRPAIQIRRGRLHEAVDAAEEILVQSGPGPIFQRVNELVHLT
jgi:hypothetical protein